ncbi:MAG: glycosyltransferase family 4 protein [Chloroflexota bacterium]
MGLRIAIDARLAAYQQAGITSYTRSLLAELPALAPRDTFLVLRSRKGEPLLAPTPNVEERALWTPPHHRWEQLALPVETAWARPDLVHSPDFVPCFHRGWRSVITVHDIAFLRFPQVLTTDSRRYYGQVERACQSAERVIVVSRNTARDLEDLLGVTPERVRVVYEAAAPYYRPLGQDAATQTRLRYEAPDGYFLFVSTIEPRKNLETLLRALAQLGARGGGDAAGQLPLLVVGQPGWLYQGTFHLVAELGLKERVRFLGSASPADLLHLYNGAQALLYPSLYEGFGLPPLEAMACGTPVAAADNSSLPEVVGDAGLLLPSTDVDAWVDALRRLTTDGALRADLSLRGLARAAQFSWRRAAEETLAVYREAMGVSR